VEGTRSEAASTPTLDAVRQLLLREAREQPLLLVFEDLHWIDSETRRPRREPARTRLLLLISYWTEYTHDRSSKTYYHQPRIDPLPPENGSRNYSFAGLP
jgi:hypothetical protein